MQKTTMQLPCNYHEFILYNTEYHDNMVVMVVNIDPSYRGGILLYKSIKPILLPCNFFLSITERSAGNSTTTMYGFRIPINFAIFSIRIRIIRYLHVAMIKNENVISTKINNGMNEIRYQHARKIIFHGRNLRNFGNLNAEPVKYGFHSKKFEVITNVSF